jgi:type IV pilus assembly protein PilC
MKFSYQAINELGNTVSGTIEADSPRMAEELLAARGSIPLKVREGKGGGAFSLKGIRTAFGRIKATELIIFTKQLRTMLRAGVSIIPLLQTLESQTENLRFRRIISEVEEDIKAGSTLSDALRRHKSVFDELYCSMVDAGERSGALVEVLERVTYIIEHEHKVKSDIRSAMIYPIMVVIVLVGAFFFLLTVVVPKFAAIFTHSGITLPLPTKICMALYKFLLSWWIVLVVGAVCCVVGILVYRRTEQGRLALDAFWLNMPIFGPLFKKAVMSRFASIFAILQSSGVNVLESIRILADAIGNKAIGREFDRISERLEGGRGISEPLEEARYFPPMVVNMVAIGEESGNLDEMLREVARHYDDEVEYATKGLADAMGPVLVLGLAGVVLFFALAIFLPMWDLMKLVDQY